MRKLLFVRVFGIGNAVMAVPAIKCYRDSGQFDVTVLVGTGPDDFGAHQVLSKLPGVRVIDRWPEDETFDVGVASMPYDGRWAFPLNVSCEEVVDGLPRPDPSTFGFSSWKRHEATYQLRTAMDLCGVDLDAEPVVESLLDSSFWPGEVVDGNDVYLGIGRKYDAAGFWEQKHWGDDNFVDFARLVLDNHPEKRIVCTGGAKDMAGTGRSLIQALNGYGSRFKFHLHTNLDQSFGVLAGCHSYVGNDTGMMHVAASMRKPVVAVFNLEGTVRKNRPLCERWRVFEGHQNPVSPRMVYDSWRELCQLSYSPAAPDSSEGNSSEA